MRTKISRLLLAALALLCVPAFVAAAELAAPGIGAKVQAWAMNNLLLLGLPVALYAAAKWVKATATKETLGLFHKLLEEGDADDDVLTLAAATWLDRKASKYGAIGPARFQVVAEDICSRVTILRGQEARVVTVLESIVEGAREGAAQINSEQPPLPPTSSAPDLPPAA